MAVAGPVDVLDVLLTRDTLFAGQGAKAGSCSSTAQEAQGKESAQNFFLLHPSPAFS